MLASRLKSIKNKFEICTGRATERKASSLLEAVFMRSSRYNYNGKITKPNLAIRIKEFHPQTEELLLQKQG